MSLVILDRDGVINQDSDTYIKSAAEWIPIPGSIEAIAQLHQSGLRIAIATNQSGLARGYFSMAELNAMHQKMHELVTAAGGAIAGIFFCPHHPDEHCTCRKPATGLLQQIEQQFACSVKNCCFVGDSLKDLQAARAKDCIPVLVRSGKGAQTEKQLQQQPLSDWPQTATFDNLAAAVPYILEQTPDILSSA